MNDNPTNARDAAAYARRPIPDGYLEQWYEFVGASIVGSGVGWGLSFLGTYVPLLNRELVKAQLTLSLLMVVLLVGLAASISRLHLAWLVNKSTYHVELDAYRRIWPSLSELAIWSAVAFVALGGVVAGSWLVGGIDVPLSLPVLLGISVASAAWTKAWHDAGDTRLEALLDGRNGVANWLEHHPGRPAARRGSWRAYQLMLQLPVDRTRHRVLSWCLGGVAFSLAWGFGAYTSALGFLTTLIIPAALCLAILSGLVVVLGLATWSGVAESMARETHDRWEQNASEIIDAPAAEHPQSVYLGERADLNEMFAKHPEFGGKEADNGV